TQLGSSEDLWAPADSGEVPGVSGPISKEKVQETVERERVRATEIADRLYRLKTELSQKKNAGQPLPGPDAFLKIIKDATRNADLRVRECKAAKALAELEYLKANQKAQEALKAGKTQEAQKAAQEAVQAQKEVAVYNDERTSAQQQKISINWCI